MDKNNHHVYATGYCICYTLFDTLTTQQQFLTAQYMFICLLVIVYPVVMLYKEYPMVVIYVNFKDI